MSFRIIVLAKQVPDTRNVGKDAMKADGTVNRGALPAIFNPEDLNALEQALRIKETRNDVEIVILTMGPTRAAEVIRESMYRGADRGYLITDRKFAGSDTLATSYAISLAVKKLAPFHMVICGRQAIDGDTAQVGPQIAELLDLPQVTYVEDLQFENGIFTIKKANEEGYQVVQVEAPCLVTVLASANEPRYMSVNGIMTAYKKEVEVWGFENISVDETKLGLKGSPTRVHKSFSKGAKSAGQKYEVDPQMAVEIIMDKLKEKFII